MPKKKKKTKKKRSVKKKIKKVKRFKKIKLDIKEEKELIYKNKTNITPTIAIIESNIFTDFKYFFVLELVSFFENAPAPKEMTK